jgi:hypothetical protein
MISLVVTLLIDTFIVKVYDLIEKSIIPLQSKFLLFSINTSFCLLLEIIIIKYLQSSFKKHQLNKRLNVNLLYTISLFSLLAIGTLFGLLIFEEVSYDYHKVLIPIFIVIISYGTAAGFIIRLSMLFISWYKSNHNWIVLLYFVSMLLIAFNLVMTAVVTDIKLTDRPDEIREFVGGSVDISVGKYVYLDTLYKASSIMSFISIWITTAALMSSYKERLIAVAYWILLAIPLVYFLINSFYQFTISTLLSSYMATDPITITIILTTFLSLSKPIGGLTFAIAFWKISSIVGFEKNIRTYMLISGWGVLLIFGANQALAQTIAPYPPFGLVTTSVLIIAAFLMLVGIYNSAVLVSVNVELRKSIRKYALESKLLGVIGEAELGREMDKTVKKIVSQTASIEEEVPVELDVNELRKYIEYVRSERLKEKKK